MVLRDNKPSADLLNPESSNKTYKPVLRDNKPSADAITSMPDLSNPESSNKTWGWRASAESDGIAVCLLIRDDNDRLPEWLAYHYHTLPLLHLVVAVDPGGRHSPQPILKRWAESNMNITVWERDADYMPIWQIQKSKCNKKIRNPKRKRLYCHLPRQRHFVKSCIKFHKESGRKWIAVIDTDEFIVFNRAHDDEPSNGTRAVSTERKSNKLPTTGGDVTVLDFINGLAQKEYSPWRSSDNPCIIIPRLRFGAVESEKRKIYNGTGIDPDTGAEEPTGPARLDTLRFRHHAARGPTKYREYDPNSYGKPIIDLSRIPMESLEGTPLGPHAATPECKDAEIDGVYHSSLLRVHHYLGSRKKYFGRKGDTRRNVEKFERDATLSAGEDDDIRPWFKSFMKEAGTIRAKKLLAMI